MIAQLLICGLTAVAGTSRAETLEAVASRALTLQRPVAVFNAAEANPWTVLLRKIGQHGKYDRPFGDQMPLGTFGLADRRPDVERESATPHKADYINLWGVQNEENKFVPSFVTLVSEDWRALTKADSDKPDVREHCADKFCFYIDQWIFTLELDGSLKKRGDKYDFSHLFVIEDAGGRVYDNGAIQPFATDDEGKAKLAALLDRWHAFQPK